jgi:membrane-associated HD superfamily phosphohydrolase
MIARGMKPQVIYNPFAITNYHNQNAIIRLLKPYLLLVMLTIKVSLLFRFATSRIVPSTISLTFFPSSSLANKMLRILLFLYSFKSLYTLGVNQGFSQCEDGSICDIGLG